MLKGCQREMIVLQTRESTVFECAYFVLRKRSTVLPRTDMVREAERIIGEGKEYLCRKRRRWGLVLFFVGAALGAGLFALTCAVIP